MKHLVMIAIGLATLSAACKKKDSDAGAADKVADKGADKSGSDKPSDTADSAIPKDTPAPFAAWDLPGRAKAWQGAWVSEQSAGFPIAVEIKGGSATVWDGKVAKHLEFSLESPCSAKLTEKTADGSSSSTTTHFTVKAGKLVEGLGDAGSTKGKSAIACVSNQILTLDDAGTCLAWTNDFGRWKSEPGTCALTDKGFTAKVNGMDITLAADGDALMSEQLGHKSSASYPDFAAAKAARDAAK